MAFGWVGFLFYRADTTEFFWTSTQQKPQCCLMRTSSMYFSSCERTSLSRPLNSPFHASTRICVCRNSILVGHQSLQMYLLPSPFDRDCVNGRKIRDMQKPHTSRSLASTLGSAHPDTTSTMNDQFLSSNASVCLLCRRTHASHKQFFLLCPGIRTLCGHVEVRIRINIRLQLVAPRAAPLDKEIIKPNKRINHVH